MPWPYTKNEIADKLVSKFGFTQDNRDHTYYVCALDGKTVAYTYVSHGPNSTVSEKIAFRMMREMRLQTLRQFRDAIDCPLTREDYYDHLRATRPDREEGPPDPPEPAQPIRWVWTVSGRSFGFIQDACLYTHDGRNVGRLVGGGEEIYGLDGRYLGEVFNYNALIVVDDRRGWEEDPCSAEPLLKAQIRWADRAALPMQEGWSDFSHPDSL